MKKSLTVFILATLGLISCRNGSTSTTDKVHFVLETSHSTTTDSIPIAATDIYQQFIYTDTLYKAPSGKGVLIQNSFPKGGETIDGVRGYNDAEGKNHAYAVFWTRVINETNEPFELKINFASDTLAIFANPDAYLKLFLPSDTMTEDKLPQFNYGIIGLKSFLDRNFNKPTKLQKTIKPNEEYIFYVSALTYKSVGRPRAGLILKDHNLYYRISIVPNGSALIPCGEIIF